MALTPSGRNHVAGFGLVLLGAMGFSLKSILIKMVYAASANIDAIALLALRMLFALPIFMVAAFLHNFKSRPPALSKNEWLTVALLGLDGFIWPVVWTLRACTIFLQDSKGR